MCFFAGELGRRHCASQQQCMDAMVIERQTVFRRIQELSAADGPHRVDFASRTPARKRRSLADRGLKHVIPDGSRDDKATTTDLG